MKYQNRIVFFLDILGFQNIINKTEKDSNKLEATLKFIDILNEYKTRTIQDSDYLHDTKQVTQFSDSIVISFEVTSNSQLFYTLVEIQHLLIDAITKGFLLRGGVGLGSLIHTDKILMGPALIEAYDLELKIANYPRIIISTKIINIAKEYSIDIHTSSDEENFIKDCLWLDFDGYYFIDYFDKIQHEIDSPELYIEYLYYLYNIIKTGLDSKNLSLLNKYTWMKQYYNIVIDHIAGELPNFNPKDKNLIVKYQSLKRIELQ